MANKEIEIIVFSKDRACQASACIESLYKNFTDIANASVSVLYRTSSFSFEKAYKKAEAIHSNKNIKWLPETDFKNQLEKMVTASESPLLMFLVDDIVFVNKISLQDKQIQLVKTVSSMLAASLRLHSDITRCYATDQTNSVPKFVKGSVWQWTSGDGDWGYPMSVDGNVYNTALFKEILPRIQYNNPNTLEATLDSIKNNIIPKYLCCYPNGPRLINIPANRVQETYKNRFTGSVTAEELNDLFLEGKQIDIENYQGIKPNTVHVPVDIKLKTE